MEANVNPPETMNKKTSPEEATLEWAGGLKTENEAQRWAKAALLTILHHCTLTQAEVLSLRAEYCDSAPRARVTTKTGAVSGIAKSAETLDFAREGIFPPLLLAIREIAELQSKLKIMGACPPDEKLALSMASIRARWNEKFKRLA